MTVPKAKDITTATDSIRLYKQLKKSKKPRKEIYPYLFRALKLEPENPEANFLKGKAILDIHWVQWPEALDCFNITITSGWKRRLVWALTLKGSLLVHLDRLQEAKGVLNQAVKTGANQLTYLTAYFGNTLFVRLVKELIRAGMLERLVPKGNIKRSAFEIWARHYFADEKTKKSIDRIAEKNNKFVDLRKKGFEAVKKGEKKEAAKHLEEAVSIASYNTVYLDGIQAYNVQFNLLWELKEFDKAKSIANRMTERFYFHKETWVNKGLSALHSKRIEEGLKNFDRALELGDDSVLTWNGKTAALLELKRYPEALKCVTSVLEKNPENEYALQVQKALNEILG